MRFIHQLKDWPNFRWDAGEVEGVLAEVSFELGKFSGRLNAIGFDICQEAVCETLATEILNSASREINALVARHILVQRGQGRSTHYILSA